MPVQGSAPRMLEQKHSALSARDCKDDVRCTGRYVLKDLPTANVCFFPTCQVRVSRFY